jgi:sterol desaturase/sphingolipid hydroxylase (fatty acid hydroxylase superfamily)
MSYKRDLTFNLRMRGLSEVEIAEAIDEVTAHEAATGNPAAAEFGKAEEYAREFPKKKRRTRGQTFTFVGGILAVIYILVALLLRPIGNIDIREFVGPVMLWPALLLLLLGVLAGFLTDYFQPASNPSVIR